MAHRPLLRYLPLVALCLPVLASCADAADAALQRSPGPAVPPAASPAPAATSTTATSTTVTTTSTTTTSTTTTTTTTTLPPVVLGFAGDTSFTHGLDGRDPLGDVVDLLAAPDLTLVNLETTVAEPDVGSPVDKRFTFKSPPGSVEILSSAGIDGVQLANNHTLDYGRPALLRTLELLDAGGVAYVGAGPDVTAAYAPRHFDVAGWRVGVVAFSRVPCSWAASGENTRPEVAWTCPAFVADTLRAVDEAAETADYVIVMVHWGIELDHCPQPYQRELAAAWVEAGADLVIGGHPHVLQGVERIGDSWVVHSTGNFAFPSARNASSYSAFFEIRLDAEGTELRAVPIRILDGRPVPATDSRPGILDDLGRWSFGYTFDDGGRAAPVEHGGACG